MIGQDTEETRGIIIGLLVFALLGLMILGLPGLLESLIKIICQICYELERFLMYRFCPDLINTVDYLGGELIPTVVLFH